MSGVILPLLLFVYSLQCCVHNQYYWLGQSALAWPTMANSVSPATLSMCGSQWYDLMQWNASQVSDSYLQYWLISFHQVCTATLNQEVDVIVSKEVAIAIGFVRDSMERKCQNLTDWAVSALSDNQTQNALQTLINYNTESTCETGLTQNLFSFANSPELFVVDYNATALAMRDLTQYIAKLTTIMTIYSIVMIILLVIIVIIFIVVYKNKKREWALYNPKNSVEEPAPPYKNEKQATDEEFVLMDDIELSNKRQSMVINENPKTK
jgi:hypothetical protein